LKNNDRQNKIFLLKISAILSIFLAISLFAISCEIQPQPGTTAPGGTSESTDSQSTSKYPPATIPSLTTQKTTEITKNTTGQSTQPSQTNPSVEITDKDITDAEMNKLITKKYLSVHSNSRPGIKLTKLKEVVVHYVANPGTSALQNWKYFENKNGVSAHFIIDLDGSILQCMPLDEVAWAIGTEEGNYTTISIECCHPDKTGKFTEATYESLVKLVSWLCNEFDLTADDVKRHYDYPRKNSSGLVWHKSCPLYFVNHPQEWEKFKDSLLIQ